MSCTLRFGRHGSGPSSLPQNIAVLRQILKDVSGGDLYIETVRKSGYRLVIKDAAAELAFPDRLAHFPDPDATLRQSAQSEVSCATY